MANEANEESFLDELDGFLCQPAVARFFSQHPNELTSQGYAPPEDWLPWWQWSADFSQSAPNSSQWELLWQYYAEPRRLEVDRFSLIPSELKALIDNARRLQLVRERTMEATTQTGGPSITPISSPVNSKIHGMSPKKAHEVTCTVDYVQDLLEKLSKAGMHVRHVVDVGAGQAYLSRALRDDLGLHILALDWSLIQSDGAQRREKNRQKVSKNKQAKAILSAEGSLSYETLPINPRTLQEAINNWIVQFDSSGEGNGELPVLLVALHACGSLTLDVLRTFLSQMKGASGRWTPAGALVVGCCYNLLLSEDQRSLTGRSITFVENHLQMAAQAPSQWCRSPEALNSTRLSFQKATWRALLTGIIQERGANQDHEAVGRRLGRINDSAYNSWPSFLEVASKKFGMDLSGAARNRKAEGQIEVFQFLRCILGPVIESFILLDRKLWLKHELKGSGIEARLMNIFEQSSGSARNVAVVLEMIDPKVHESRVETNCREGGDKVS